MKRANLLCTKQTGTSGGKKKGDPSEQKALEFNSRHWQKVNAVAEKFKENSSYIRKGFLLQQRYSTKK
jgi:hypothetical protein